MLDSNIWNHFGKCKSMIYTIRVRIFETSQLRVNNINTFYKQIMVWLGLV